MSILVTLGEKLVTLGCCVTIVTLGGMLAKLSVNLGVGVGVALGLE